MLFLKLLILSGDFLKFLVCFLMLFLRHLILSVDFLKFVVRILKCTLQVRRLALAHYKDSLKSCKIGY